MSKQVEAKRNWEKKNIRLYSFSCNRTYDADIIEFMEQKENKYDYLRSLVRRDMQRTLEIELAKEVERPKCECNCSHCDYFKFAKTFVENIVGLMLKHEIYTVDDLMTELNHANELLGGRE